MKNWKTETWINVIIGIITSFSGIFEKQLNKLTNMEFSTIIPFLFPLGLTLIVFAILRHQNRKTRVLLIGIHLLDNIRFHKIKDGKIKELLYVNSPDKANNMQEERELRTELTNLNTLSNTEIEYIIYKLYWSK